MKNFVVLLFLLMFLHRAGFGQYTPEYFKIGNTGEFLKPRAVTGAVVGDVYMDSTWEKTNILLYKGDQRLDGMWFRYDIRANVLELLFDRKDIRVMDARLVKTLSIISTTDTINFVNGRDYKLDGVPRALLLEVMVKGKISLYKEHSFWIKSPDYNVALAVGNKDETLYKKNFLYYSLGPTLTKVSSKKKLLGLFGEDRVTVEKFMKLNKLNPSHEFDLARILEYYNSLTN